MDQPIFIQQVTPATTNKGKAYQAVVCGDGVTRGAFFHDFRPFVGQTVTVRLSSKGDLNYIALPDDGKASAPAPKPQQQAQSYPTVPVPAQSQAAAPPPATKQSAVGDFDIRVKACSIAFGAVDALKEKLDKKHLFDEILRYDNYLRTGELRLQEGTEQA